MTTSTLPGVPLERPAVPAPSKVALWTGRVLSGLIGAFFLMGGVQSLLKPAYVVEGTVAMGYAENTIVPLGIVSLTATLLYLFPRTAVLGAILLTGYLGGAVATHVRAGDPLPMILFPAVFGAVVWLGLYLRDPRVRALAPIRSMPAR